MQRVGPGLFTLFSIVSTLSQQLIFNFFGLADLVDRMHIQVQRCSLATNSAGYSSPILSPLSLLLSSSITMGFRQTFETRMRPFQSQSCPRQTGTAGANPACSTRLSGGCVHAYAASRQRAVVDGLGEKIELC